MRILFTALQPPGDRNRPGGVATWIGTLAAELARLGHHCEAWGPEQAAPSGRFDVGVISNAAATLTAAKWCKRVVGVAHGVIEEERPSPFFECLYTSEEVRDRWRGAGPILRQPIDLEFWSPGDAPRKPALVFYSYRARDDLGLAKIAAGQGLAFRHISAATPEEARDAMREAAVVVASGRAIVEAMACGAGVVLFDDRNYQPPLFDPDIAAAMAANYSGRGGRVRPGADVLARAVSAQIGAGAANREHAEQFHDVRRVAAQLLEAIAC